MSPPPSSSPERAALSGAVLTVDLSAIVANYRKLAAMVPRAEIGAVVKADGYGLGAAPIGRALAAAGCETFFVAYASEGAALRPAVGASPKIFVLHGFAAADAALYRDYGLIPVLSSMPQLASFRASGLPPVCAAQFDTGMSRLGLEPTHAGALSDLSWDQNGLDLALVMSHLACSDEPAHPMNAKQLAEFRNIRARFAGIPGSLAASSGAFLGPEYHFDLIRPGIALYGGSPIPGSKNPMTSVVRLTAQILQIRQIDTGATAGYGATFTATAPRRLATVGLGYADGIHRSASNRGAAMVGGVLCAFAGRVSMDLITLDVSACPPGTAEPGQMAEFLGPQISLDDAAAAAGTAHYEVITRLGPRIARRYVGA